MTAVLDSPLVEHRACRLCRMPINDQGMSTDDEGARSRGWIHTLTGQYRCPPGTYLDPSEGTGPAFAWPDVSESALEEARDEAYAVGEGIGREAGFEDGKSEGLGEGEESGRLAMFAELNEAIQHAVARVGDDATADQLREALADAWNGCCP